ncbi:MAG TPA: type VI secretion system accessory protein TagJ [Bryobacteraceae bacterium]|jgi:type VI secretion system protein ImpE|nr:type VI secretion system accessory protein TagJ [Bryobacteraceae bacterium]
MSAQALLKAGKLTEAITALNGELRDNPGDVQRRTFLFELLCFAGNFDRADKQLDMLMNADNPQAGMGGLLYKSALHAERDRQAMFEKGTFPISKPPLVPGGTWNGKLFETIEDADPRIGARLEVFAAGQYMWIPFEHIESIEMPAPKRLRDLLWAPAKVTTGKGFEGMELGEVLVPVIAPLSWKHPDEAVRLGRATEWQELEDGEQAPVGLKMLLVDGEDVPFLEMRQLEIQVSEAAAS